MHKRGTMSRRARIQIIPNDYAVERHREVDKQLLESDWGTNIWYRDLCRNFLFWEKYISSLVPTLARIVVDLETAHDIFLFHDVSLVCSLYFCWRWRDSTKFEVLIRRKCGKVPIFNPRKSGIFMPNFRSSLIWRIKIPELLKTLQGC